MVLCHGYYEFRGKTDVLDRVLVSAAGAEL
jgi:hypothetical protein